MGMRNADGIPWLAANICTSVTVIMIIGQMLLVNHEKRICCVLYRGSVCKEFCCGDFWASCFCCCLVEGGRKKLCCKEKKAAVKYSINATTATTNLLSINAAS